MSIKRMQTDQPTRYARGLAADARRYVALTRELHGLRNSMRLLPQF
jgi:hypothetical protein